jgi:alkanesulfonate monooxygenase SsuD/methylene tetrahydromethanopterin reductase-like flavin-dependent oxidoreductase (luciferase family)
MAHTVRFGIRCSQHHREWAEIKEWFQMADDLGLESAWVFDHMIPLSDPRDNPNLEGWTLLAGLAEATKNIEIGPMVTGITYRNPSMLLKEATTVDHISNGRALLGVGAAWFEGEHDMFGFEFPGPGQRVSMLEEALQIFKLLQSQDRSDFGGKYYELNEAIFEPKPVRNPMPLVIGGSQPRMLGLIARHADWWDNNFSDPEEYKGRLARIDAVCAEIGRDPAEIRRSTTRGDTYLVGKNEDEIAADLQALRDLGMTDFLFHVPSDPAVLRNFAEQTIPALRERWS